MNESSILPRILIIDDEPVLRQTLERALERSYRVLTRPSGDSFDQVLKDFDPQLIIMDVTLPGEDGWQLCSRLRESRLHAHVPLMFLSGLSDQSSAWEGFTRGGDYHMGKPFELSALLRVIKILLSRKHRRTNDGRAHAWHAETNTGVPWAS